MSANVESMMYVKRTESDVPWHKEGMALPGLATAAECMVAAGMNWTVEKRSAAYRLDEKQSDGTTNTTYRDIPEKWATVRSDNGRALGIVGAQYTPLQNSESFGFFDALVGEGLAIYETAGVLDGGKKVWLLAKLPGQIRVLGDDVMDKYCLLANGHDGCFDISIGMTPTRVVCQNTLNMALAGRSNWLSAPHTKNVAQAVANMGKLLATLNASFEQAGEVAQGMAGTKFSTEQALNYFAASYPLEVRECIRGGRQWKNQDELLKLYETGTGQDLPGVRGTLWAAYNAVAEFEDYVRPTRETTSRLARNAFGQGANTKLAAYRNAQLVLNGVATFGMPEMEISN